MGDKDKDLPLGLVYKEYTNGGSYYFIIYDKSNLFYEQLVVHGDQEISRGSILRNFLSAIPSDEESRKAEAEVKQGRYPGVNHLPSDKPFLLSEQEFNVFVENHPNIRKQLKQENNIEELIRVP